jgi:hypothetical protein
MFSMPKRVKHVLQKLRRRVPFLHPSNVRKAANPLSSTFILLHCVPRRPQREQTAETDVYYIGQEIDSEPQVSIPELP